MLSVEAEPSLRTSLVHNKFWATTLSKQMHLAIHTKYSKFLFCLPFFPKNEMNKGQMHFFGIAAVCADECV